MQNPIPGNTPGLPDAVSAHVTAMHGHAVQISAIICAVEAMLLSDAGDRKIISALCSIAIELSDQLEKGLDSVEFDKAAA